jgi:hypothetical protein
MPRALKVFKTHIGFYDLLVAAPSMKAAAKAWQSDVRLFAQGFAAVTKEANEVKAALAQPGVVLRKAHGQKGEWQEQPAAIAAPKVSKAKKKAAAAEVKRRHAEEKKAKAQAARQAKQDAEAELREIEEQEAALREKRRRLQKKFRLHSVK